MGSLDSVQELGTVKNFGVYLLRPRILSNSITKVVDLQYPRVARGLASRLADCVSLQAAISDQ
jgi:hypothetical protein